MQIKFTKDQISDPEKAILRCGYGKITDRRMGKTSFAKRIHRDFYPRFHVYIKAEPRTDLRDKSGAGETKPSTEPLSGSGIWVFDLHLDQKRPIYEGVTAHSGEYDGEVVEREAARIKTEIERQLSA